MSSISSDGKFSFGNRSRKSNETEQRDMDVMKYEDDIYYSPRYYDDEYEYRHVNVPKQI
ncbi:hypothetical protein HDV06_002899, partial [Boothiomyces sp. JEL0866]